MATKNHHNNKNNNNDNNDNNNNNENENDIQFLVKQELRCLIEKIRIDISPNLNEFLFVNHDVPNRRKEISICNQIKSGINGLKRFTEGNIAREKIIIPVVIKKLQDIRKTIVENTQKCSIENTKVLIEDLLETSDEEEGKKSLNDTIESIERLVREESEKGLAEKKSFILKFCSDFNFDISEEIISPYNIDFVIKVIMQYADFKNDNTNAGNLFDLENTLYKMGKITGENDWFKQITDEIQYKLECYKYFENQISISNLGHFYDRNKEQNVSFILKLLNLTDDLYSIDGTDSSPENIQRMKDIYQEMSEPILSRDYNFLFQQYSNYILNIKDKEQQKKDEEIARSTPTTDGWFEFIAESRRKELTNDDDNYEDTYVTVTIDTEDNNNVEPFVTIDSESELDNNNNDETEINSELESELDSELDSESDSESDNESIASGVTSTVSISPITIEFSKKPKGKKPRFANITYNMFNLMKHINAYIPLWIKFTPKFKDLVINLCIKSFIPDYEIPIELITKIFNNSFKLKSSIYRAVQVLYGKETVEILKSGYRAKHKEHLKEFITDLQSLYTTKEITNSSQSYENLQPKHKKITSFYDDYIMNDKEKDFVDKDEDELQYYHIILCRILSNQLLAMSFIETILTSNDGECYVYEGDRKRNHRYQKRQLQRLRNSTEMTVDSEIRQRIRDNYSITFVPEEDPGLRRVIRDRLSDAEHYIKMQSKNDYKMIKEAWNKLRLDYKNFNDYLDEGQEFPEYRVIENEVFEN
tara:strand:+ start:2574 stop:4859 length:2286 start_codon:yes stop_codon:yes gene_type:complete